MDLSVVVVSYNVRLFLEQCLNSVIKAFGNLSCEVIVVDNNSTDGSCSMITDTFPSVRLISNNINAGFSAACNQGIRISAGEYILLLNPDTVVEESAFSRCISFMKEHPLAGAVGVMMVNGKGRFLPESKRAIPTPAAAFFKLTGLSRLFPGSGIVNRYYLGQTGMSETTEAEVISGAFMFLKKTSLYTIGLLDESYFMYGEDIDLSYRLLKAGFKNYYFPEVRIVHYKGESTGKGEVKTTVYFYRAMLIFVNKHYSHGQYRPFLFLIRLAIYCLGFFSVLKNIIFRYFRLLYRKLT